MKEILLEILKYSYAWVWIVSFIAYLPTIKDVYLKQKMSANFYSYLLWTITTFIWTLYVVVFTDDLLLQLVYGISFISCFVISIWIKILEFKNK